MSLSFSLSLFPDDGTVNIFGSFLDRVHALERVQFPPDSGTVVNVRCGGGHCLALTEFGHVYSWGRGLYGRLGHGDERDVETPRCIEAFRDIPIRAIACGLWSSAAVSDAGEVYVWGKTPN